ncbi:MULTISPECIES: c-type cytochrome [Candidatus Ichthyocystis]|uniref:c-type cytochrome n=1 Tax=Candidatus Ichthyocystis TaxID=2929841 RepID=UPI000B861A81|nr:MULTISPECIES: c-type cytochrome [Ichthyocystis]
MVVFGRATYLITVGLLFAYPFVLPADTGDKVYGKVCAVCHAAGIAGAPRFGNKEDWKKHKKPIEELYKHAINGYGVMPPKGGNSSLTDDEVKAAVDYMIKSSG